jgi:hypothetical protein
MALPKKISLKKAYKFAEERGLDVDVASIRDMKVK